MNVISQQGLEQFEQEGFVHIPQALAPEYVEAVRDYTWAYFREHAGMLREELSTWRNVDLNKKLIDKAVGKPITERLKAALDQLLGSNQWQLSSYGGLLPSGPVYPLDEWKLRTDLWHTDDDPCSFMGELSEVMLFSFYSSVKAREGGTLALSGSHRLIKQVQHLFQNYPNIRDFTRSHPYLRRLCNGNPIEPADAERFMNEPSEVHDVTVRVVELTGEPGDVVICHRMLFHGVNMNCGSEPRLMRRSLIRCAKPKPA